MPASMVPGTQWLNICNTYHTGDARSGHAIQVWCPWAWCPEWTVRSILGDYFGDDELGLTFFRLLWRLIIDEDEQELKFRRLFQRSILDTSFMSLLCRWWWCNVNCQFRYKACAPGVRVHHPDLHLWLLALLIPYVQMHFWRTSWRWKRCLDYYKCSLYSFGTVSYNVVRRIEER